MRGLGKDRVHPFDVAKDVAAAVDMGLAAGDVREGLGDPGVIQSLPATPPDYHDPDLPEAMYDAVLA